MQQGTAEWKQARCGKITASRIADIMARTKSGPAASRKNYIADLVVERMTDEPTEYFVSREMAWGTEKEPEARAIYELEHDVLVQEVGFIDHPLLPMSGASPDGLIGDEGIIEIKCPNTSTHIKTLMDRKVPSRYNYQMQWVMECTGRSWGDFVSYDPRMKNVALQMCVIRVERDDDLIKEIRIEVETANTEIDEIVAKLEKMA